MTTITEKQIEALQNLRLYPHPLRFISSTMFHLAACPLMPRCLARKFARLSGYFYWTDKAPSKTGPTLTLAAQVTACGLLGLTLVAGAVLLRELTR
jgi:hypothetical protein